MQRNLLVFLWSCLALVMLGGNPARADSPMPPPQPRSYWSPDKTVVAVSDPEEELTTVYRVAVDGKKSKLWSMRGWFTDLHVTNDGEHLVIGYGGQNLLRLDHRKDEPMLTFVHRGKQIAVVKLDQLISDQSKMPRTASHYAWGRVAGINAKGQLAVETVEGDRLFDPKTGRRVAAAD